MSQKNAALVAAKSSKKERGMHLDQHCESEHETRRESRKENQDPQGGKGSGSLPAAQPEVWDKDWGEEGLGTRGSSSPSFKIIRSCKPGIDLIKSGTNAILGDVEGGKPRTDGKNASERLTPSWAQNANQRGSG